MSGIKSIKSIDATGQRWRQSPPVAPFSPFMLSGVLAVRRFDGGSDSAGVGGASRLDGGGKAPGHRGESVGGLDYEPDDDPDDVQDESDGDGCEEAVFEDGAGFVAIDEGEFDVYDGPDEEGPVGGGPAEGNAVVVQEGVVEPESVVESIEEPVAAVEPDAVVETEAVVEPKSREEWLAMAGLEVPQAAVTEDGPGASGDVGMDRDALEDYICALGRTDVEAGLVKGENGTRERGAGSDGDKSGGEKGYAWAPAVAVGDVDDGVSEGTRGLEDGVEEGVEAGTAVARVATDGVVSDGEGSGSEGERAGSEEVAEGDGEPLAIPHVVGEGGELEEFAAGAMVLDCRTGCGGSALPAIPTSGQCTARGCIWATGELSGGTSGAGGRVRPLRRPRRRERRRSGTSRDWRVRRGEVAVEQNVTAGPFRGTGRATPTARS